ncbi:dammarenediol II synthase-like protein [Tanacetum coccineum]
MVDFLGVMGGRGGGVVGGGVARIPAGSRKTLYTLMNQLIVSYLKEVKFEDGIWCWVCESHLGLKMEQTFITISLLALANKVAYQCLLLLSQMSDEISGEKVDDQRLYDAVNFLLYVQSPTTGGFAVWEPPIRHPYLQTLNPSEMFADIVVERE